MHTVSSAARFADTLIAEGIAAAKIDNKIQAFECLTQALASEPRHEMGWLWLSGVVASDAERYYCLEQVLTINPRNVAAQRGLSMLPRGLTPTSPLAICPPAPEPERTPMLPAASSIAPLALPSLLVPASVAEVLPQVAGLGLPRLGAQPQPLERPDDLFAPVPIATPAAPSAHAQQVDIDIVVRGLGANQSVDQVSRILCEQKGYAWSDAQELVARVQWQNRTTIARRQAPFLLFLGIITLIGGLALLGFAALRFSTFSSPHPATYVRSPYAYRNMIVALCTGLMMTLGSSIGMIQVIRSMWK